MRPGAPGPGLHRQRHCAAAPRPEQALTFDDVFLTCQIVDGEGASRPPTQSRAELQMRRRRWDKTSEVPAVHGASRWWALSKAVKPHFLKRYWRARAQFPAPAASTPEPRSAIQARRPATTRWASVLPPPPRASWATVTP